MQLPHPALGNIGTELPANAVAFSGDIQGYATIDPETKIITFQCRFVDGVYGSDTVGISALAGVEFVNGTTQGVGL
jgi:hypothetical protein